MTAIPSSLSLSAANLDSLERLAIALGLFFAQKTSVLPDTSPNFEAVTFKIRERAGNDPDNPGETLISSAIEFECFFKLQSDAALEGGILLENIEPFFTLDAPTFPESPASLLDAPALPTIPTLANAEQLMVWALLTLNASLYPENQDYIQIAPAYGDNELKISFQFPLDSQALSLNSYQYVAASKRIVNQYLELDTGAVAQIGLDAYEVAVSEGYLGTRAEWLLTLVGPQGIQGIQGPPGNAGPGVTWQGVWDSGTSYASQDAVHYAGSSYIANAPSTNKNPATQPEWDLWVEQGETGPAGADGQAGPQGLPGADGAPGAAGTLTAAGSITLDLVSEPATPSADKLVIWASALDGLIYKKDDAGIVEAIGTGGAGGGVEVLTADLTYFVRTDGSDSNNGLTNTSGGAFATIPKAIDVAASRDWQIFDVSILLGDGTYQINSPIVLRRGKGFGKLRIAGNTTNKTAVKIDGNGTTLVGFRPLSNLTNILIEAIEIVNVNTGFSDWDLSNYTDTAATETSITLKDISFKNNPGRAIYLASPSNLLMLRGANNRFEKTANNSTSFCTVLAGDSAFDCNSATITMVGSPVFSSGYWLDVQRMSKANIVSATISGAFSGNYLASDGAMIYKNGATGINSGITNGTAWILG